jgi:hypothetical protein
MDNQCKAAFIFSQSVACLCELEAMKASNAYRERRGEAQAYDESSFRELHYKYCIDHNDAISFLKE